MNLNSAKKGQGFFESFSDVIFATMAIFVLLMTIFAIAADESSPRRKIQNEVTQLEERLAQIEEELNEISARTDKSNDELAELRDKRVEIGIAVDKSGSMEEELANLLGAIRDLAVILPKVVDEVSISVVAYRIGEGYTNDTDFFPMMRILDTNADGGASLGKLVSFQQRQRHASGLAPIKEATEQVLGQFSDPSATQVLMLLGDVGPYEENFGRDVITNSGRERERELVDLVSGWVKSKPDRNIILLFSGRDEVSRTGLGSGADRRRKHSESMKMFRNIAEQSGQPDAYTENQSSMLATILIAALKRK